MCFPKITVTCKNNSTNSKSATQKDVETILPHLTAHFGPYNPPENIAVTIGSNQNRATLDAKNNSINISIDSLPESPSFRGSLCHELGHIINPTIDDFFMEGAVETFACSVHEKEQWDWSYWEKQHKNQLKINNQPSQVDKEKLMYAVSYDLMNRVYNIAGSFRDLAKHTQKNNEKLTIDINRYINSLEDNHKKCVVQLICKCREEHLKNLDKVTTTRTLRNFSCNNL